MKKIHLLFITVGALAMSASLSSCGGCCTGQELPPALRPMPNFAPDGSVITAPVAQPVYYQK